MRDGGMIALELSSDKVTGRRLVEYLHVGRAAGGFELRQAAARDFYAADGQMQIVKPRLSVNGVEQAAPESDLAGAVVRWGRYALSLAPREGFVLGGELQGASLTFAAGADLVRIESAERIVPGSGVYNVYVREGQ